MKAFTALDHAHPSYTAHAVPLLWTVTQLFEMNRTHNQSAYVLVATEASRRDSGRVGEAYVGRDEDHERVCWHRAALCVAGWRVTTCTHTHTHSAIVVRRTVNEKYCRQ